MLDFIGDALRISQRRPMCKLIEKEVKFMFGVDCQSIEGVEEVDDRGSYFDSS